MESPFRLDIEKVRRFLPHRAPFLLVDRILEIQPVPHPEGVIPSAGVGTRVIGIKNVTYNEPFFQGHFPEFSIMPGVLILEAMAQVASFAVYPSLQGATEQTLKNFRCILAGVDSARFRKPVVPGDTLRIEVEVKQCRGAKLYVFECLATVDGQKVAEAEILASLTVQN
jgi:3-hydroxyacyl-[acyl-carrier-protein] dehydratase